MSSSFPARLAGTLLNKLLNMLPASPTGFILLGTTNTLGQLARSIVLNSCLHIDVQLTARIYAIDPNIKATELRSQQLDEVISSSFARGIAGQINIGCVMHTRTRAGDDDRTAAVGVFAAGSSRKQVQKRNRHEVVRRGVDAESIGPVTMSRRPHGFLQFG